MLTSLLCVSILLGDVPPRPSACATDDECVITATASCCSCCPGVPRAVSRQELAEQDCGTKNCGVVPCKATACRPVQDPNTLQAVCRAGTCRAEPVGGQKNPSVCIRDADCVAASFSCCETCCPPPTIAITQAELLQKRGECATTMCAMLRCASENCPPRPPPGHAVCRSNRCELTPSGPAPANECRADTDCQVITQMPPPDAACHRSTCGCCPGAPQAMRATRPLYRGERKRPAASKQPFGLSSPSCAPCASAGEVRAACENGRCTLERSSR